MLFVASEEIVRPLDRRSESALALGQVSGPAGEKPKALLQSLEDLGAGEGSDARSGELERKRKVVEPSADVGDIPVGLEVGSDRPRPREEEADRFHVHQRGHRVLLLTGHVQRLAARHKQVEPRTDGENARELCAGLHHLLEAVEDAEHFFVLNVLRNAVL